MCRILLRIKKYKENLKTKYSCKSSSNTLNLFPISISYNLLLLSRNQHISIFCVHQHKSTQNSRTQMEFLCACVIMCVLACVTCMADGFWISNCRQTQDCDLTFMWHHCQFDSSGTDLLSVSTKRQREAGPPSRTHHSLLEALCLFLIHSASPPKPTALLGRPCVTSQPKPWGT